MITAEEMAEFSPETVLYSSNRAGWRSAPVGNPVSRWLAGFIARLALLGGVEYCLWHGLLAPVVALVAVIAVLEVITWPGSWGRHSRP